MVKCADCGFLAARNRTTRELDEAEGLFREYGTAPIVYDKTGRNPYAGWEQILVCFARSHDLGGEVAEFGAKDGQKNIAVHYVINQDRECKSFTKWSQGSTPKEHREMMDREEWRKWREDREEADRKWRAEQDLDNKRWQAQENRKTVLYTGGFTILGAAIAAIVSWFAYGRSN